MGLSEAPGQTSSCSSYRLPAECVTTLSSKFSFNAILKNPIVQIRGVLFDFMGTVWDFIPATGQIRLLSIQKPCNGFI
jgi:hypothetical protein